MDVSLLNETIDEPVTKEMNFTGHEEKLHTARPLVMKYVPLDMQAADEEYTEVIAFTEENSDNSEEEEESPRAPTPQKPAEEVLVENNTAQRTPPPEVVR